MPQAFPAIPYGWSDFAAMRRERTLYVDKTRFLHTLEAETYALLIRPRRFGKSCWVSLLENYYDQARAGQFGELFADTDIGREPTPRRSRYVVLRFDFSAFEDTPETLRERFETYCHTRLRGALTRNARLFPRDAIRRILAPASIDGKLNELFEHAASHGIALCVLIDEYDNFANTVLAHRGTDAYESFTHGGGFYRSFFATLKAGTAGGGIERLFVTGVSTMDNVTSGFNIAANISLDRGFNDMLGFTAAEVRGVLETYRGCGVFDQDVDETLGVMGEWYNGYRFAKDAEEDVYNTDMVLYHLKHAVPNKRGPDELIDRNVRIDYGKLRHLLTVNRRLAGTPEMHNGNFDLLRRVIEDGHVDAAIESGFPLERLHQRENFLSLLHYFGLLSIRASREGVTTLGIPNQTVKRLMYGYLRDAYQEAGVFAVDVFAFSRLMHEMAFRGAWRPVFDFLADAIDRQTAIRDYMRGEKVVQGFLAAYLTITDDFLVHTEAELNKGFADFRLTPMLARYPGVRYGYVIELKYLPRGSEDAQAQAAGEQAQAQLQRYLADDGLRREHPSVAFRGLALVFRGWEMVSCEAAPER